MKSQTSQARGSVSAVSASASHGVDKPAQDAIQLVTGRGVRGDAHEGETVQHRSRVARDPTQPNLRQVHLLDEELFAALAGKGFDLRPGLLGENVTTRGLDLLGLPTGATLHLGTSAVVEVTGLRNPCGQLNGIQAGLMGATRERDDAGNVVRKAGIMAIVLADGEVRAGDEIRVMLPEGAHRPLEPV
jgi:MOSC domain-containing protein YiiM